ncbi:MAG: carboxymuconolactone decarboxylase family protein [Dehalococcoidia bacterium]|jgi:4-carboxymuconolactone decarboxylase|nr:carboxymuconolactone decarboxylase family protein [Dehalococcoidia bacterium]MDW8008006.1 carboxymuconolactone decarboxylase family protein [Chloroflexota bacterium]
MAIVSDVTEPRDEETRRFLERVARAGEGRVLNVFRATAHSPELALTWWDMMRVALTRLSLAPRLRELAILRLFLLARVPYGFAHHVAIARRLGMRDDEIWAVRDYESSPALGEMERLVLRYTDATVTLDGRAPSLGRELLRYLSERELVELTFCIGIWSMMARLLNALAIEMDEGTESLLPDWWRQEKAAP